MSAEGAQRHTWLLQGQVTLGCRAGVTGAPQIRTHQWAVRPVLSAASPRASLPRLPRRLAASRENQEDAISLLGDRLSSGTGAGGTCRALT